MYKYITARSYNFELHANWKGDYTSLLIKNIDTFDYNFPVYLKITCEKKIDMIQDCKVWAHLLCISKTFLPTYNLFMC